MSEQLCIEPIHRITRCGEATVTHTFICDREKEEALHELFKTGTHHYDSSGQRYVVDEYACSETKDRKSFIVEITSKPISAPETAAAGGINPDARTS